MSAEYVLDVRSSAQRDRFQNGEKHFSESGVRHLVIIGETHAKTDDYRRRHHEHYDARPAYARVAGSVCKHRTHIQYGEYARRRKSVSRRQPRVLSRAGNKADGIVYTEGDEYGDCRKQNKIARRMLCKISALYVFIHSIPLSLR